MSEIINEGPSELVPVAKLKLHPRNVNQGDLGAVDESIEANGFFGGLVVQKSTGHVLVGNHRLKAAKAKGLKEVPVFWVDVDDDRAMKILLADNRTARLGMDDEHALRDILMEMAETTGLQGSGYDGDDLDALIQHLGDGDEHPYGAVNRSHDVTVACASEAEHDRVVEQIEALGLTIRVES